MICAGRPATLPGLIRDPSGPEVLLAMPANLPPQYLKAEEAYRRAGSAGERLELLRELFKLLPKHKGTEKLQCDLKSRISRTKDEIEGAKTGGKKSGVSHRVPREGAGQVVLIGPPNSGKSALLAAITNARPEVAPYPFTTRSPQPGMAVWQDVRFQVVDLPPVAPEFFETWMPNVVRSADAALFVVDLADDDLIDAAEASLKRMAEARTELVAELPFDLEDETLQPIKAVMIANKGDDPDADTRLGLLRDWFGPRFPIEVDFLPRGDQPGRGAAFGVRFAKCDTGLYQSAGQTPGPFQPGHGADREHNPGSGQGDPSRAGAVAQIRQGLGHGGVRGSDGQAGS